MDDAYDSARFYDCRDSERLSHVTPEAAIEELLDVHYEEGESTVSCIARLSPIEVTGYNRIAISESERDSWAGCLAVDLIEMIEELYGDPGHSVCLADGIEPEITRRMREAIDWVLEHGTLLACTPVGKRVYEAAEVETMMRLDNPQWFEDEREPLKDGTGCDI